MNELLKLFIAGITLGNGPCLFTCMPIVLPAIAGMPSSGEDVPFGWIHGLKLTAIFSVSRVFAYSVLGFSSVVFYDFVFRIIGTRGVYLRPVMGILVAVLGIFYFFGALGGAVSRNPICVSVKQKAARGGRMNMLLFGLLVGFSPCPPLLAVLTYIAATAESPVTGLLSGAFFGLGTTITPLIPLGTAAAAGVSRLKESGKWIKLVRFISALVLFYFGLILVGLRA